MAHTHKYGYYANGLAAREDRAAAAAAPREPRGEYTTRSCAYINKRKEEEEEEEEEEKNARARAVQYYVDRPVCQVAESFPIARAVFLARNVSLTH